VRKSKRGGCDGGGGLGWKRLLRRKVSRNGRVLVLRMRRKRMGWECGGGVLVEVRCMLGGGP